MKFAIDPTEGKPKDYDKEEVDKRTLQLGSTWTSNISNETRKAGLCSDVQPKALWPGSESPKTKVKTQEKTQGTEGITSKEEKIQDTEGMTLKENPVWPGYEDGHTPDEAASDPPSELEENNVDPNEPEDKSFQTWIIFEGDLFAVRLEQLSAEQEHDIENGKPYRFMDIEDSSCMKQQTAERVK